MACGPLVVKIPPGVASVRVIVVPTHKLANPEMGIGKGLTDIAIVALQPSVLVKVIVSETGAIPLTSPVALPIVVISGLDADHTPASASVRRSVCPTHTTAGPPPGTVIGLVRGFTVTTYIDGHGEVPAV
jgi:hypothetical protein